MRSRTIAVLTLTAALAIAACGDGRPTAADWQPTWLRLTEAIPVEAALAGDDAATICSDTLAFLRGNRADLLPSPDLAIDDAVTTWFEIAEDAFFECPPSNEQIGSFAEAYAELNRLEAEVDVVLELRSDS